MPLWPCSSAVPGRPPVNFLQREARTEEEQHRRACTDSDHHSARMPLREKERDKISVHIYIFFTFFFKCTSKLTRLFAP